MNRPAARDDAFESWVEDARDANLETIAGRFGARLKRSGRELVGPCPVCGGTDRFSINPVKRIWNCRQAGRGGDVIALVQYVLGVDFLGACEDLTGRPPPGRGASETAEARAEREARLARRAEQMAEAERQRDDAENHFREAERRRAYAIWRDGRQLAGSQAAAYLGARGIRHLDGVRLKAAAALGFWSWSDAAKQFVQAGSFPAMLAAIVDTAGRFLAVHITYLDPERPVKATVAHPETGEIEPAKKIRGPKRGGVIRLAGPAEPTRMAMAEGIENTLTLREMRLEHGRDDGAAYWAGVDLKNIGGAAAESVPHPDGLKRADRLGRQRTVKIGSADPDFAKPAIALPDSVTDVVLIGDGDSDRHDTANTLRRGAARWRAPGRQTRIIWAEDGRDLNDMWRAHLAGANDNA